MGQLGVKSMNLIGLTAKMAHSHVKVLSWEHCLWEAIAGFWCGLGSPVGTGSIPL